MANSALPRLTLAQTVLPQRGFLREALVVVGFSALVAVCAQITIPLPFIPGDTLKLFLAAAVLPSAWALVQKGERRAI